MSESYDIAIIGSGPAGLTAAVYVVRGGASTLVIAGEVWGGQLMLTSRVDNFPGFPEGILGPDLMKNMRRQAENLGAEFLEKNVTSVDFDSHPFGLMVNSQRLKAKTVIIATGALTSWLGVPGEKELIGRGVSTCAPCDGPFFKGKKVAVVGGGDTALEEASVLTKYASEVIIIHRRDIFKATEAMRARVKDNPKIKIYWNTEVVEINGTGKVESLNLKNNKTGEVKEEKFDGVFMAIGHKPDSAVFEGQVETDDQGYITNHHTKYHTATSIAGVFVAGDVSDPDYRQAVTAAGSGCQAALDTLRYLAENDPSI